MPYHISEQNYNFIFTFNGHLDDRICIQLQSQILTALKRAKNIIFDLLNVDYISAMFIHVCNLAINNVKAENFNIINPSPNVLKVINTAGIICD
ncbi:MAG: STAS domain-containing protein [bacterium]|nr:STAS domain-containing protein [bacterium]